MKNSKIRIAIYGIACLLVLTPLFAMQITKEVNWTLFDFVIAALLLFSTAAIIDVALMKIKKKGHLILIITIVLIALVFVWAEMAVGIFNSPISGN